MRDIDPPIRIGRRKGSVGRPHTPDRRRALILSLLFLSGLGVLALTVTWATSVLSPAAPRPSALDARTGRIMTTKNGRCQQLAFHNDSGKLSNTGLPCPINEGEPAPTGTPRRLDAISKSFLGRD